MKQSETMERTVTALTSNQQKGQKGPWMGLCAMGVVPETQRQSGQASCRHQRYLQPLPAQNAGAWSTWGCTQCPSANQTHTGMDTTQLAPVSAQINLQVEAHTSQKKTPFLPLPAPSGSHPPSSWCPPWSAQSTCQSNRTAGGGSW